MKQPEALRLADELAVFATWRDDVMGTLGKSAAELRRLHEANQAMLEALKNIVNVIDSAGLVNLSHGVQLGATVWFVKASDAMEFAKTAIAKGEAK